MHLHESGDETPDATTFFLASPLVGEADARSAAGEG
jgi:hypothetical protein